MKTITIPDPNDSWAQVELYRWQHGHLPGEDGKPEQPLNVAEGLRKMADALDMGDPSTWPSPFNVISVLRYAAKKLEEKT